MFTLRFAFWTEFFLAALLHSFITACLAQASVPFGFCFCCIRSGTAVSKSQLITQFLVPFGSCYCTSNSPLGHSAFYGAVSLNSAVCTRRQGNFLSTFLFRCFSNRFHGSVERMLKKKNSIIYSRVCFSFWNPCHIALRYPSHICFTNVSMSHCWNWDNKQVLESFGNPLGILWESVFWQFEIHFFLQTNFCGSSLT